MESKTFKDDRDDTSLPPSFEEACNAAANNVSRCNVDNNDCGDGTRRIGIEVRDDGGPLPEKPQLTDVPLNAAQMAMIYDKEIPPPYEADPSRRAVWSTETSKLHPGNPRTVGRNKRRYNVIFGRLLLIITTIAEFYICFECLTSIASNNHYDSKLRITAELLFDTYVNPNYDVDPQSYEGRLVAVAGPVSVDDSLEYDECDVSYRGIKLRRSYDRSYIFTRFGEASYFSSRTWPEARIGEDQMCHGWRDGLQKTFAGLKDGEKIIDEARIGSFKLGHRLKEKFADYVIVSEKIMPVGWDQAVSVMFSGSGTDGSVYTVMGQVVNGTIEPYTANDFDVILQREGIVTGYDIIRDRVYYRLVLLQEENWWSWFTIVMAMLMFLIAIMRYLVVVRAAERRELNHVMLSSQG